MSKLDIKNGVTSRIVTVFISKVSDGLPLTGLVFNSASLSAHYKIEGSAPVVITLVTAVQGTFTSSGFIEVGAVMPGHYELGIPNAALAAGEAVVLTLKGFADMQQVNAEIEMTLFDKRAAIQTDVTAIKASTDNLPADPASETNVDANETKIDSIQSDTTALLVDPATEANVSAVGAAVVVVDTVVDAIKVITDVLPDAGALTTIQAGIDEALGLSNKNSALAPGSTYDVNSNMTLGVWRHYDSAANAITNNGVTGLLRSYTQVATFNANSEMTSFRLTLNP